MVNRLKLASLAVLIALVAIAIMAPSTIQYMNMQADAATVGATSVQPAQFGGRCTLTTGVPVMTSSVNSATTIYYTPATGVSQNANRVTLYNGDNLVIYEFSELSNITTNSTTGNAGPAAVVSGTNYDLFVWNKSGTLTFTRGPAWTSGTVRAAGLSAVKGIYVNGPAITNGPAVNRGTYVCSVASRADLTINYQFGGAQTGGKPGIFEVWNTYNRVPVVSSTSDSTASWTYTAALTRPANSSVNMRTTFLRGLDNDAMTAQYAIYAATSSTSVGAIAGLCLDNTGTFIGVVGRTVMAANNAITSFSSYGGTPGLGSHFLQACEYSNGGATSTFQSVQNTVAVPGMTTFLLQ